jgi:hypothetical protein
MRSFSAVPRGMAVHRPSRLHRIANIVLRLGNVYGPRQNPFGEAGVVASFSEHLRNRRVPTIFGDGRPTRRAIDEALGWSPRKALDETYWWHADSPEGSRSGG